MAFIYEKVSQKEIEKYDLDERWNNHCNSAIELSFEGRHFNKIIVKCNW